MPAIFFAWLAGEGLITYRSFKDDGHAPLPGHLLGASLVFVALGFAAQNQRLSFLAGAMAWGFDLALFLKLAPEIAGGATKVAAANKQKNPVSPQAKGAKA